MMGRAGENNFDTWVILLLAHVGSNSQLAQTYS
jgi:hypothetical protein